MIGEVEELGAEFDARSFGGPEFLEKRKVEPMKSRAKDLSARTAQWGEVGLTIGGNDGRISEGGWIHPLVNIMFSADRVLSGYKECDATHAGSGCDVARDSKGLPSLEGQDAIDAPSGDDLIDKPATAGKKLLAFTKGQVITAAGMEDVADIGIAGAVVYLRAEAGRAVGDGSTAQLIDGVRAAARPGEVSKETYAVAKLMLQVSLQSVIVHASPIGLNAAAWRQIRILTEGRGVGGGNEKLMDHIGSSDVGFDMTAKRTDVSYLERGIGGDLILHGKVHALKSVG